MILGLAALAWAGWNIYFGVDSTAWPHVPAQIVSEQNLQYSYQVNGVEYYGNVIRFGDSTLADSREDLAVELQKGQGAKAFYNPDYPAMACLMVGFHKLGVYVPLALGLFFMTIAGLELRARYLIR